MTAHSIKNPHIIHFVRNRRYICIGACSTTPSKHSKNLKDITCKNCLRILKKEAKKNKRKWNVK